MLGSAEDVLVWARRWLGYAETPSNRTVFAAMAGHRDGQAWCATFVSAAMRQCGVPVPPKILVPSSRTMFAEAQKAGLMVPAKNVRPGDIVHMTRGSVSAWLGHVAIVEKVLDGGPGRPVLLQTIEGNTNGKGSATGGGVLRHERPVTAWNLGAWRPPYKTAPVVTREVLRLPDGRLCVWDGQTNAAGARVVRHVTTIPAVESLLREGWVQHDYSGPVQLA